MKASLTKLLLALSLVANPVAVLASDFHNVELKANWTTEETKCDPSELQETLRQQARHDSESCEMPCCEDSECTMQGICIVQHSSYFVAPRVLSFNHPIEDRGWDSYVTVVPELELPPEPPPPIHV